MTTQLKPAARMISSQTCGGFFSSADRIEHTLRQSHRQQHGNSSKNEKGK